MIPILFFFLCLFLLTAYESRWISYSAWLNKLYKPLQSGFFFSFLGVLIWSAHAYTFEFYQGIDPRIFSIGIIAGIAILIGKVTRSLGISRKIHIAGIYLFMLAILLPTLYFPYIPGALFLLLLSVHYGYKVEAGLSVAALAYFIVKYYYDLQLSLLQKSALLFFPGILLLLVWFFYNRQLKKDEKI